MTKLLKMTNVGLMLMFLMLASASMTSHAGMAKQEAVEACLKEQGLSKEQAEQCKSSGWSASGCSDMKGALQGCVRSKMMGG